MYRKGNFVNPHYLEKNKVDLIVIYRMGNFVCHHWICTLIYLPLSYPCRFLKLNKPPEKNKLDFLDP